MDVQWTYSKSHCDPESGPNLDEFELARVQRHFPTTLQGQTKSDTGIFFFPLLSLTTAVTFEVQVSGSIGVLSNGA